MYNMHIRHRYVHMYVCSQDRYFVPEQWHIFFLRSSSFSTSFGSQPPFTCSSLSFCLVIALVFSIFSCSFFSNSLTESGFSIIALLLSKWSCSSLSMLLAFLKSVGFIVLIDDLLQLHISCSIFLNLVESS